MEAARADLHVATDEAIRALEAERGAAAAREEKLALAVANGAKGAAAAEDEVRIENS